ncbi:DUF1553 domain-containing protein [Telmatocola sphagniphila]|uniref:DUF1553 domain-containing protein n=1 Tax=Telmatocola sphagniphila TaxID=1123043 RepID=A0A8E6B485_9BACT|nr:DUF1553 domain-containing protein [Telmatocola sphagniphila]QVL31602.1 DUF1553 domain-containing protein [Telmatocola sphagniphila]
MKFKSVVSFGVTMLFCLLLNATGQAANFSDSEDNFFEKDIRPLLVEKCVGCHGDSKSKGGLTLNSRAAVLRGGDSGSAIVPGQPDKSLLIKAVRYQGDLQMPPKGKLTNKQIELLEKWVKLGARWPGVDSTPVPGSHFTITEKQRQFWSFQTVKFPPLPAFRDSSWAKSEIDRLILTGLRAKNLAPAAPADKRTLLRRATFDLIGLPPKPEEIEAFLKDDSPEAFAKVVDRLLASPHYGERWGRHWLDVVRYADARDLIQLPKESDFREAWRYRDWVVDSFNRDMPYTDFVRSQIAGDLQPSTRPDRFNKEGLVATGMLAIADFVPGDVDKNQMIADYVNDQIDVVGRAFLGLSISCARCHDHKFDPISTEDYYALAGIFFSTRIIPGPVPGNTPLVKVPLLSPNEIEQLKLRAAADETRRKELERSLSDASTSEYRNYLRTLLDEQSARYILAAHDCRTLDKPSAVVVANRLGLHNGLLAEWIAFLARVEKHPEAGYPALLREIAADKLSDPALVRAALEVQNALSGSVQRDRDQAGRAPEKYALDHSLLFQFRADDPRIAFDEVKRIAFWPNFSGFWLNASPPVPKNSPETAYAKIGQHQKPVIRFQGQSVLAVERPVPPMGSLFIVFRPSPESRAGERIVGWEDADSGQHGLGLMTDSKGRLHAILRKNGLSGDLVDNHAWNGFETVCISWGPGGTTMRRNAVDVSSKTIDGISSDPKITALAIGGPGSGNGPRFTGDIAELRVYDRPLSDSERLLVDDELHKTWFEADGPRVPKRDAFDELVVEMLSTRGAFWPPVEERIKLLPAEVQKRFETTSRELNLLRNKPAVEVPMAVAVQDGGPKGTRHEGFKDATVFLRGDSKRLGKTIPRGFPKVLAGNQTEKIIEGSGRLQLADWLTHSTNPLTSRVMVNRIWQHHFGEGLVRTPNDFGERGERPTNPELLDYLATKFIESKWSAKTMHRLIMLSAVYQQSCTNSPDAMSRDPENRLFGRMNRQRLEAEAIRDSLLAVSGRLDSTLGGAPFSDLAIPRRTLYLMSSRTAANTSDFGRLFDAADPSMIVAQRGQSVVAPQALFFLNDPFVRGVAKDLAARIRKETPEDPEARIEHLYSLTLGRKPAKVEIEFGKKLLLPSTHHDSPDPLERYCLLILSSNEFLFMD